MALIVFAIFLVGTIYDYYHMPLPKFFGVEDGDELIESGDKVYMIRKDKYERGDIIIANDISWKDKKKYHVSRKIVGLPGEYIEDGGISLHNDQYAVRTAVSNSELFSIYRDVIPAANIYGVVVGNPLTDFKSRFTYFINRTKYIPEYIRLRLSSSFLSLSNRKVPTEIPIINRTSSVIIRNDDGFIVDYVVGAGDNLWKLIEAELLLRGDLKNNNETAIEVDKIKDRLKAMSSDELRGLGFSSGDIGILKSGDKINVIKIIGHSNIEINKKNNEEIKKGEVYDSKKMFVCGVNSINDFDGNLYPTVLINNQCWMAKNLNVGVKIVDTKEQSNNNIIEKHCYSNDIDCVDFGGLYQWNEMMQYSTTEKAQGICPSGWHIPTDMEQHSLERYFATGTCDSDRIKNPEDCVPAGNILRKGGSSGFNIAFAGSKYEYNGTVVHFWSSSELNNRAWQRDFLINGSAVSRTTISKINALSVRCLKD
jgi:uncharacterized protein (TIGR02145 family)